MPTPFTRVLNSLESDSSGWTLAGIAAAAALATGFCLWMILVPVTVYEVTTAGRVEASEAVYSVASPVEGRVILSRLTLGREVREGEILMELDSAPEQFEIREQTSRQEALRAQIAALRAQIDSERLAREQENQAARVSQEETRAQARESEIAARHAEDEERRLRELAGSGLLSQRDYQQGLAEAQKLRANAQAKLLTVDRSGQDHLTRDRDRAARIRGFESQIAALESQIPTISATIGRLSNEIERKRVRAPARGKIGEAAALRPGAVIKDGEKLGAIVSSGRLSVVAQFPPDAALGRIRSGQPARVRLDGFPWVQFGALTARVTSVGSEVRDGAVRVEMEIDRDSIGRIVLQHGLPGSVEVEVERATPWTLLMRHAGLKWAAPRVAAAAVRVTP